MFIDMEQGLLDVITASALKDKLRAIDALPDVTPETFRAFAGTAPAVYVAAEDGVPDGHMITARLSVLCLARNARGHEAQRRGDGDMIGLYEIVQTVLVLTGAARRGGFKATRYRFDRSTTWRQFGVTAAVINIEAAVMVPSEIDPASLANFATWSNVQQIGADNTGDLNAEIIYPQE